MKLTGININLLFLLLSILLVKVSYADERVEVMTAEGAVTVGDTLGKSTKPVQSKSVLPAGNVLSTGPTARAVVRVGSEGFVILGKNSKIEINRGSKENPGFFKQISGVIYYAFNSIKSDKRPIEVRTAATTIGIRGTRFLVTENEDRNEIGMRKGVVNVTSTDGDFEIHKQAVVDEFEAFKKAAEEEVAKNKQEFEDYKAKTQQEFIEYKREFSLEADHMASFDGNRVVDLPLSGETKKDMESVEEYADKWLSKVRD
jgi:ferric-dicitrate binding protein FerR (iron transport regulator)